MEEERERPREKKKRKFKEDEKEKEMMLPRETESFQTKRIYSEIFSTHILK